MSKRVKISVLSFLRQKMQLWKFAMLMSIVNLLLYNIPFFVFVSNHSELTIFWYIFLQLSLLIVMLLANFLACYILVFLFRYFGRVLIAIGHIISSICVYFVYVYSTIIDDSMIKNVLNTRSSEALPFVSWPLLLTILLIGVVPAIYVLVQKIDYGTWKRFGIVLGSVIGVVGLFILLNFNRILWISKYDTELGGLLMPWSYTVNTGRVLSAMHKANKKEILLPDGRIRNEDEKTAVVLVIGESARRANFSLYGYEKHTNPCLESIGGVYALPARSCATYTTAGTKAILEYKSQRTLYEILPNYLYRMGVDVVWRTSNWGEPPVHIDEYETRGKLAKRYKEYIDKDYDGVLFYNIKQRIIDSQKNKVFIVLHTSTSHGPSYNSHYPNRFQKFVPIAESVEEGRSSKETLFNAYDNTILYTDYLLANLIDSLNSIDQWKTAMLFVSDHGESLGENGLYMHGVPMKVAPKEQYEIPFIVWTKNDFRTIKNLSDEIEQHSVFHSVLNLFDIESEVYDAELDIFER